MDFTAQLQVKPLPDSWFVSPFVQHSLMAGIPVLCRCLPWSDDRDGGIAAAGMARFSA